MNNLTIKLLNELRIDVDSLTEKYLDKLMLATNNTDTLNEMETKIFDVLSDVVENIETLTDDLDSPLYNEGDDVDEDFDVDSFDNDNFDEDYDQD